MTKIQEMLDFNAKFVAENGYEQFKTTKYPSKKTAILSCMDTRLTKLLPAALGIENGDVKLIKNAGALVSHPFGSVMRSLLVGIYDLEVEEIYVINHYDCGMSGVDSHALVEKMRQRGITDRDLDLISYMGVDFDGWLQGFGNETDSVKQTVQFIRNHPLVPHDVVVAGFLMDPVTGRLDVVDV